MTRESARLGDPTLIPLDAVLDLKMIRRIDKQNSGKWGIKGPALIHVINENSTGRYQQTFVIESNVSVFIDSDVKDENS